MNVHQGVSEHVKGQQGKYFSYAATMRASLKKYFYNFKKVSAHLSSPQILIETSAK